MHRCLTNFSCRIFLHDRFFETVVMQIKSKDPNSRGRKNTFSHRPLKTLRNDKSIARQFPPLLILHGSMDSIVPIEHVGSIKKNQTCYHSLENEECHWNWSTHKFTFWQSKSLISLLQEIDNDTPDPRISTGVDDTTVKLSKQSNQTDTRVSNTTLAPKFLLLEHLCARHSLPLMNDAAYWLMFDSTLHWINKIANTWVSQSNAWTPPVYRLYHI